MGASGNFAANTRKLKPMPFLNNCKIPLNRCNCTPQYLFSNNIPAYKHGVNSDYRLSFSVSSITIEVALYKHDGCALVAAPAHQVTKAT